MRGASMALDGKTRKRRRRRLVALVKTELSEFCRNTTAHGFNHGLSAGSNCSRAVWCAVVTAGFLACAAFVADNAGHWSDNPVVTVSGLSSSHSSVAPAVTVCRNPANFNDPWAFAELLLAHESFTCDAFDGGCPSKVLEARKLFRPLLDWAFEYTWDRVKVDGSALQDDEISYVGGGSLNSGDWNKHQEAGRRMVAKLQEVMLALGKKRPAEVVAGALFEHFGLKSDWARLVEEVFLPALDDMMSVVNSTAGDEGPSKKKRKKLEEEAEELTLVANAVSDVHFRSLGSFLARASHLVEGFLSARGSFDIEDDELAVFEYLSEVHRSVFGGGDEPAAEAATKSPLEMALLFSSPPFNLEVSTVFSVHWLFSYLLSFEFGHVGCDWDAAFDYFDLWQRGVLSPRHHPLHAPERYQNPCQTSHGETNPCCHLVAGTFASSLEEVMTVMKFSIPQASPYLSARDIAFLDGMRTAANLTPSAGSPYLVHLIDPEEEPKQPHPFPTVPFCSVAVGIPPEVCKGFDPVPTDVGVCQAFGHAAVTESYADGPFRSAFEKVFFERGSDWDFAAADSPRAKIFYLDAATSTRPPFVKNLERLAYNGEATGFLLALNDRLRPFSIREKAVRVPTGYKTTVKIYPTSVETAPSLRSLPPERRGCRFADEHEGVIKTFSFYSREGCVLECRLGRAAEICGCTPWHYPTVGGVDAELCDFVGNSCFEKVLLSFSTVSGADANNCTARCPEDCERMEFRTSENSVLIDAKAECSHSSGPMRTWCTNRRSHFVSGLESRHGYLSSARSHWHCEVDDCEDMVRDEVAVVELEVAAGAVPVRRREPSSTFAQRVSAIGGTLGLFTGLSLIGCVEFVQLAATLLVKLTKHVATRG